MAEIENQGDLEEFVVEVDVRMTSNQHHPHTRTSAAASISLLRIACHDANGFLGMVVPHPCAYIHAYIHIC